MSDNLVEDAITKVAHETVSKIYDDVVSPSAKPLGNILSLVTRAINVALSPYDLWLTKKELNIQRTKKLLEQELLNIPPDKIVQPESYVAVPALQQIAYSFDSDELRKMYAKLLATSMNSDKKWEVHPAFVDIIKQLTPDEAKFLSKLKNNQVQPLINITRNKQTTGYIIIRNHYTDFAIGVCDNPQNTTKYLDNLERLKLINIQNNIGLTNKNLYKRLQNLPEVVELVKKVRLNEGDTIEYQKGIFELTDFGKEFCNICL